MLKLFHTPFDAGSRFIRLILEEYREEVELIEVKPWERREDVLAVNAAGSVPVLIDGELPLCGVNVIAEYLDETRGALSRDNRLMPENPIERAEVRRLMEWYLVKLDQEATKHLVQQKMDMLEMNGGAPDSTVIRAARSNVRPHIKYTSYLASNRNYIGGLRLTYADIAAAAAFSIIDYMGDIPWSEEEPAKNWYGRMKSRPSFRKLLAERVRGLPPSATYTDLDF